MTIEKLRRAIEPASPAELTRFLLSWQGVTGARRAGRAGLLKAIEQLQGFEIAAGAWEDEVIRARVDGYQSAWLDELCLSGEIVWGRFSPREAGAQPTRAALIAFARRSELAWILPPPDADDTDGQLSDAAREVLGLLRAGGAAFFDDLALQSELARGAVEDALWELVGAGRITGDGFAGLRALIARTTPAPRFGRFRPMAPPTMTGRWALLRAVRNKAIPSRRP